MRLVYLGTPSFAVPSLDALVDAGHTVVSVYTQPDRPKGRGQHLAQSPVKEAALRLGLAIEQPERVRRPDVREWLAGLDLDVIAVVGYGQIIPQAIIDLPRHGIINVHGSLLPKFRGAAPIQWAIASGETVTGVTTMQIDAGLDTGDMLLKAETPIGPDETALELAPRLARIGASLLLETLRRAELGTLQPQQQNPAEATHAPILQKSDGQIDWGRRADEIHNRCRGLLPWPGTFTMFRDQQFNIWRSKPAIHKGLGVPGTLRAADKSLLVTCGQETALELLEVQLEGRKRITADAFRNGNRLVETDILGDIKH